MKKNIRNSFLGAIVGCAVGDALGAPFEGQGALDGMPPEELLRTFRRIGDLPEGIWTDDTQLTLMLAESIIACRGINAADFADRLTEAYLRGETLGWGMSTRQAARNRARRGMDWREMGDEIGRAGNGCAMRASPIGLWLCRDIDSIPEKAREVSIVSHKDPRAVAGASVVATVVAYCVERDHIAADELLDAAIRNCRMFGDVFPQNLSRLPDLLRMDETEAVSEIVALGQFGPYKGSWGGRITPYVLPTVMICLYWFLRFPNDFGQSVARTIITGGDVDTTGAIAGAISGALNGIGSIPTHLVERLYLGDHVMETARRLFEAWCAAQSSTG